MFMAQVDIITKEITNISGDPRDPMFLKLLAACQQYVKSEGFATLINTVDVTVFNSVAINPASYIITQGGITWIQLFTDEFFYCDVAEFVQKVTATV